MRGLVKNRPFSHVRIAVPSEQEILITMYREFNARNIEAVLARLDPNVDWPNGMEGGRVLGLENVRAYWTRQFQTLDPRVDPVGFSHDNAGRTVVEVHQVVRDLAGVLLADQIVHHAYTFENNIITRMDIE